MIDEKEAVALHGFLEERLSLIVPETNLARLSDFVLCRLKDMAWTFAEYLEQLTFNRAEIELVIDASTIGETYFFRDESHFALLLDELLPYFSSINHVPVAWSAAASTGEEALSIASLYARHYGGTECLNGKIWASDINAKSLSTLTRGRYRHHSLRDDGSTFHSLLDPWIIRDESGFAVDPRLYTQVGARTLNLMTDSFDAIPAPVDILFLKNMLIYFPLDRRKIVYRKVSEKLSSEGILILGKSELPFFENPGMVMVERNGTFFFVSQKSTYPDYIKRGASAYR